MHIKRVDHIVIAVSDMKQSVTFYRDALGLTFLGMSEQGMLASFVAGDQIIKLETTERPGKLMASCPVPGSVDICFELDETLQEIVERLSQLSVKIVDGPVEKQGAHGSMTSVYVRDPDGSLIELSSYNN